MYKKNLVINITIRILETIATCFGPHLCRLPVRILREMYYTQIQHAVYM